MKQFTGNAGRKQRGDMLLEALISILLLGVLGLGLSYAGARVLVQQRFANTQDLALSQMRASLESQGLQALCAGTAEPLPLQIGTAQLTPTLSCTKKSVTVTVSGDLPAMTESIDSVYTHMRYATPEGNAQATQLLGSGSVVIHQ